MHRCIIFGLVLTVPILLSGCDNKPAGKSAASGRAGHDHSHEGHSHDHAGHDHGHEGHNHGHGNDPDQNLSLKDALAKTAELSAKIRNAAEKGDLDPVHDDIHHIGHLLGGLVAKAKSESKSEEDQGAIKQAADALFSTIDKIDSALHDGKPLKFDEIKEAYDAGVAGLKALQDKF